MSILQNRLRRHALCTRRPHACSIFAAFLRRAGFSWAVEQVQPGASAQRLPTAGGMRILLLVIR
jgi:hypothetical protein